MGSNDIELDFIDNIKNKNRENRAYLRYLIGFSVVFSNFQLIKGLFALISGMSSRTCPLSCPTEFP